MKKIITFILVFFTFISFSQNSNKKTELNELKTSSKINKTKNTLKNTFSVLNKPVLLHFGLKTDYSSKLNDSTTLKISYTKKTKKTLKPELLKASKYHKEIKDSIPKKKY